MRYLFHIEKRIVKKFRNVYNDVVQLIDEVSTYREILTGGIEMYHSSISNNINAVMKKRSVKK